MQINRSTQKYLLRASTILLIITLAIFYQKAEAQQMFVDDAEVTTHRSFQIESWYGSRESWFLTAISPVQGLELGTGIGFDSRDAFDPENWILEAKFAPGNLEERGTAIGLAAGLVYNFDGDFEEYYAYIPVSRMIFNNTSVLHFNAGIDAVLEEDWSYEFITGLRGDFGLTDRFALLAEVAAANFGDFFYQGGLRISLVPDLLEMDITYGEGFRKMETAPGFNIGIAFTPDQLW